MASLRRMTEPEYDAWLAHAVAVYAADKVASGQWAEDESVTLAAREHATLLPQGLSTPDHYLYRIDDDRGVAVGVLWFAVKSKFDAPVAYVYNIEVMPEHRRQGHAHGALLALEHEARRLGLTGVALHVFGHNTTAQALYAKLGYSPTNINLFKSLGTS